MSAAMRHSDDAQVTQLRIPPHAVEAEQAVLGGLMLRGEALAKIADWISPEDFYRRDHQMIFHAIRELSAKDQPFDAVTLGDWFDGQGLSDLVANGAYLVTLASTTPSAANIVAYAEIVRDKALLRQMIEVGTEAVNAGFHPEGRDTSDLIAGFQQRITALAGTPRAGGFKAMRDVALRWMDDLQTRYLSKSILRGLATPWTRFNDLTGGLVDGDLVILAARPSMGKSAWAVVVALLCALAGKRVLFFNLEMTDVSIFNRCIAALMHVPLRWLRNPSDDSEDGDLYWGRVTEGVKRLRDAALWIDDTPALRFEQIAARARREHLRQPIDLLIVDHLHLIPLPGKTRETVEIGVVTSGLKALAKELDCPVILLSQLNRGVESRPNKRPVMKDLRESGNIEQDADLIVFLYRDDYYAEQEGRPSEAPGLVEMVVAKQRNGETGRVWAKSNLGYGRFDDFDGDPPVPTHVPPAAKARSRWASFGATKNEGPSW